MTLPAAVKYIINVCVIASLIGGIAAFRRDDLDLGLSLLFLVPIAALAPRLIYKKYFQKDFGPVFLAEIELIVLAFLFLSVSGEAIFYQNIPAFDSFVHFASGILITILLIALFYEKWRDGKLKPLLTIFLGGLLPAIANEIYEAGADAVFGTKLWGDNYWTSFKPLWVDTMSDILIQTIGAIFAVAILKKYFSHWLKRWEKNKEEATT